MLFHHHGYVSEDPRTKPKTAKHARSADLPDNIDVLIVGGGPAGMILAAQLSMFPTIETRLIERRPSRLILGHADGIQARSVETFQAFDFAEPIIQEAYHLTQMNIWGPDEKNPEEIVRTAITLDDETGISEFPHLIVNQARVLDYFAKFAENSPSRLTPDWGWELTDLVIGDEGDYPVQVTLKGTADFNRDVEKTVHCKYVVGTDGARSLVRKRIGRELKGAQANHAWAVMDILYNTDFPDIRTKCAIQSKAGSILLIPREGGYLVRLYVDLGETAEGDGGRVRDTTVEDAIDRANAILHPYKIDVKHVAWSSVYEVGHRVTDKFDDVPEGEDRMPRVFIAGDACHTHSAKAGQGMNVSMQDTFNLGWKLGYVLTGLGQDSLLSTYSAERQEIAQNLIDFDREWSTMMAKKPEEFEDKDELAEFYISTQEFPMGFMTQYKTSALTVEPTFQDLAQQYPVGKRFRSAETVRVADGNKVHLGHLHKADGRFRIYAFADRNGLADDSITAQWSTWLGNDPTSPLVRFTPVVEDRSAVFDVKVIYQDNYADINVHKVPAVFRPEVGPYQIEDLNNVFGGGLGTDIFAERDINRDEGVVIVVRPDQYVAAVLPMSDTRALADYFAGFMVEAAAAE
ncbi:FAD-dependent monooxygenase [Actinomyces minihominis]|uniref:FAD-dependent monooxygenase n=1 Tax=Actinomyces minihominis TaxID=2002838 RepID=UPI000C075B9D|nr:FAD-dependent monooxygenase [Actinomyces minihominis]